MSTAIYDRRYHQRFVERAKTELGQKIYRLRWDLVQNYAPGHLSLLDYGCASGAFHLSSPNGYKTAGYDVNPHCGFDKLPAGPFDVVTMWDSIEHLPDPVGTICMLCPTWLFISTPNLESVNGDIRMWKHYRPGEHLYYFDLFSLTEILENRGYRIVEHNFAEGTLRDPENPKAIITVVARKR